MKHNFFWSMLQLGTIAGIVYILSSLLLSVVYVQILTPSFANDLWWANYTLSGNQALLIDIINQFLTTNSNGTFDVLASQAIVFKEYSTNPSYATLYFSYIHTEILGRLTSIEYAVKNLRQLSPYWTMRMNVQHCWVDFNQTFEIAHTELRQARCKANYQQNAAAYLEAILRNQRWSAFVTLWGGNGNRFNIAIERGLQETLRGREFLSQVSTAYALTSIDQELTYWKSFNFTRFELQWQNRWQAGISETILIENAFGMQQEITLKALDQVVGPWSSQALFWIPLQDFFNAMQLNRSLIRGTSRYFGANISTQLPAINLETYRGIASSNGSLTGIAQLFHTQIGPYLSIDIRMVPIPSELLLAYNLFIKSLYSQLVADTQLLNYLSSMGDVSITPIPSTWSNMTYLAGDPMCTAGTPTSYLQQSFDFTIDCSHPNPFTLSLSRHNLLFALNALQPMPNIDKFICSLTTKLSLCLDSITSGRFVTQGLEFSNELNFLTNSIPAQIKQIKVGIMQYANASGKLYLMHQLLLTDDIHWNFFGWCFLAEWAAGTREVLTFEGDVASVVLISNAYPEQKYVASGRTIQSATKLVLSLVRISTVVSIVVGAITLLCTVFAKSKVVWQNLFYYNRLVGSIWIGRPLALLRGMSAILILATSQLSLTSTNGYTKFVFDPRPILQTFVIVGEANWIVYVLSDILVIIFRDTARIYDPLSSAIIWCTLVAIELLIPVNLSIEIDRQCVGNDMDYGLFCSSGRVQVGSYSRVWLILGIQVIGVLLIAVCASFYHNPSLLSTRLFLSSTPDVLTKPLHVVDSKPTYDLATCTLCGLLPLPSSYQFDLTLWTVLRDHTSD
ncbi:hypothetical protein THRCLA_21119, partial [Thraustotheca clavata]